MAPYSQDHKFSKAVSECFRDIGVWDFVNPIASQPWGGRNRVIGRIRVFEKYLQPEDVLQARWLQNQAIRALPPRDTQGRGLSVEEVMVRDTGIVHLNKLMEERSGGTFWQEITDIADSLPSVMDYASVEYAPLVEQWDRELATQRREQVLQRRSAMHVVPAQVNA